nr:unnamed protein product [Digitaria exilis]
MAALGPRRSAMWQRRGPDPCRRLQRLSAPPSSRRRRLRTSPAADVACSSFSPPPAAPLPPRRPLLVLVPARARGGGVGPSEGGEGHSAGLRSPANHAGEWTATRTLASAAGRLAR